MKKILLYVTIITAGFFTACESNSETKEVKREESGKVVKEPVSNTGDDTKRTSVSVGSGGVNVNSKGSDVKVDKNGIKVGSKDVNIEIKK